MRLRLRLNVKEKTLYFLRYIIITRLKLSWNFLMWNKKTIFWLGLSLTFSLIYSTMALKQAFSGQYVIQDDARLHVFWMRRFLDPELFPHDLIADYFQFLAPWGYQTFYKIFALIGVDPVVLSKILPGCLGLFITFYGFLITIKLLPIPLAGFISTLMLNQNIWMKDDLASGTPRAFFYPLFLAFLYYLLQGSWWLCLLTIALQGAFYPSTSLISVGILMLRLFDWQGNQVRLSRNSKDYLFCAASLGVLILFLLPDLLEPANFGEIFTAAQAKEMPEWRTGGRVPFFHTYHQLLGLCDKYSGPLPTEWCSLMSQYTPKYVLLPPQIWLSILLPIFRQFPSRFPLTQKISQKIIILPQVIFVSLGLFILAHWVLFKLYLPQRYTEHTLRIVVALAGGIALTIIINTVLRWSMQNRQNYRYRQILGVGLTLLLMATMISYPYFLRMRKYPFPRSAYIINDKESLYQFLTVQPKDTLIATLADEGDNIPSFTQRSVLMTKEYISPFYPRYVNETRQRISDLLNAQYSPDISQAKNFIQQYGIDFWLIENSAFTSEYIKHNKWLHQFQPAASNADAVLKKDIKPALARFLNRCSVWKDESLVLLKTSCILNDRD